MVRLWRSQWSYESLYKKAESPRLRSELEAKLVRNRHRFLFTLILWLYGAFALFRFSYHTRVAAEAQHIKLSDPLLSGAPQFTLLTLIIGLSAYLRVVRSDAVVRRDEIAAGKAWNYPIDGKRCGLTDMRLKLLDNTSTTLLVASPFLIFLFILIAARAFFDAYARLASIQHSDRILSAGDVVILAWTAAAFLSLGVFHFIARMRDDRVRAVSRSFENEFKSSAMDSAKPNEEAVLENIADASL